MKRLKAAIGLSPRTAVYLQNGGNWYGNKLSSCILTCNLSLENTVVRLKKLASFLEREKHDKPVTWRDVMERKSLFDESYDDEQAGDLLRDECSITRSIELEGGFLFGGFDGMKYSREPASSMVEVENNATKWKQPVVLAMCQFNGDHKCSIEKHKDTIENLMKTQDIIKRTFARQEIKKWEKHPSERAKPLLDASIRMLSNP